MVGLRIDSKDKVRVSVVRTKMEVSTGKEGLGGQSCIHNRKLGEQGPLIGGKSGGNKT